MNNELKMRVLQELMDHLEKQDADELRPKPKAVEIESVEVKPLDGDEMKELHADAVKPEGDKGPMEKLMEAKGEQPEMPEASPEDMKEGDELSEEELEDLLREYEG